jgi:hypothetical protein
MGEIIGAIAVVGTLGYLAAQIRRSTAQAKSDAFIKMNEMVQDLSVRFMEDLDLTKDVLAAGQDWDSISPAKQFQVHMMNTLEFQAYESYFYMMRQGQLEASTYQSREGHAVRRLSAHGTRVWWNNYAYNFDPDFVTRINERLNDPSDLPAMQDVPFFDSSKWSLD